MDTGGLGNLFEDPSSALRGLHQRFDDLRLGGCCQRIAWGKLGCIAYITQDRLGVEVRSLKADQKDGKWILSPPVPIPQISAAHEDTEIVHICWNSVGSDIAVVDIQGRVSIYTVFVCTDRFSCVRSAAMDHEDDLGALVGLWWLNMDRPHIMVKPAHRDKETGMFRYPYNPVRSFGPFNPVIGNKACVGVTRSGIVKLWYAQDQTRFHEVSCELENNLSAEYLFSHAAFTADKDNTLLLAAYTHSRQLRTYKISINWNLPSQGGEPPKQVTHLPNAPSLTVSRLDIEDFATPHSDGAHDTNRAHLTRLEILPPFPVAQGPSSYATILGFFVSTGSHPFTVISRWELRMEKPELHSAFDQLASRRNSTSHEKLVFKLRRIADVIIDKCVISVTSVGAGSTLVALAFTDGSIEVRERINLKQIAPSANQDIIGNMWHAGFHFPTVGHFVDLALSPNIVIAASITHNSEVSITQVNYEQGSLEETPEDNPHIQYAAAALAHQHTYSCQNHINNDDIVMVAQKYHSKSFVGAFLSEAQRALGVSMDFGTMSNSEKLLRNPFMQRCLSLQQSLDYLGDSKPRPIRTKMAAVTLQLKHSAVGFAYFMNNVARQQPTQLNEKKSLALQGLLGLIKWESDLHVYVIDELLELARRSKVKGQDKSADTKLIRRIVSESNSCALAMTLSSACRGLLRYNSRALSGFDRAATEHLQSGATDEELRQGFQSVKAILESSPVRLSYLDRLLADVEASVRNSQKDIPEQDRQTIERNLFLNPHDIPPEFDPVIEHLMTQSLPQLKNEIDPSRVFFYDNTWLGLYDDKKAMEFRKKHKVDTLKKVPLRMDGSVAVRRCVRCCEATEDTIPNKWQGLWLGSVSKMCLCGSLWTHD